MVLPHNIPDHQKLTVLMRVEGGSLGPEGLSHLEKFCEFAQNKAISEQWNGHLWEFQPRIDITLPEISFKIGDKQLSQSQTEKYLDKFNIQLDDFTWNAADQVAILIEQYFNRDKS